MALTRINNNSLSSVTAAGIPKAAGEVLQVVTVQDGNKFFQTSYVEETVIQATITPKSATSKIIVEGTFHGASARRYAGLLLYRGATNIIEDETTWDVTLGNRTGAFAIVYGNQDASLSNDEYTARPVVGRYVDTNHNTTSEITYSVKQSNFNADPNHNLVIGAIRYNSGDYNEAFFSKYVNTLTLTEIAGA